MRNILIILLLFLFWSCTACNSDNPKTDHDNFTDNDTKNDADSIKPDIDLNDGAVDVDVAVDQEIDDDVELADVDYQGAEDCPELVKAKFPYYNDDKSIHFCRKCDKPTAKDPQCVENLWKDAAAALYAVSPESECKDGYPCEMPTIVPETLEEWIAYEDKMGHKFPYRPHQCDLVLSPGTWAADSTAGAIKHFEISDGKVGIKLMNVNQGIKSYTTKSKVMIYSPVEKTYKAIAPFIGDMLSYNKGCFIYLGADLRTSEFASNNRYLFYSCENGRRELAYPEKIEFLSYTPGINDRWVIANIQEEDGTPDYTMYAKIGEWKWTKLMEGLSLFPQIVNDKVVFHDIDGMGFYCDLSKAPKSIDECVKINREGETIRFAVINENNETEAVYESRIGSDLTMTKIVISKEGKKTYSVIESTFSDTDTYWVKAGYTPENYRDGFIFYTESYTESEGGQYNGNHCFYNLAKKKRTCMNKLPDFSFKTNPNLGYGEWEGKWIVYQFLSGSTQAVRDLDCYCEKEGVCPFEE